MKTAIKAGYVYGVYWICRIIPFIDDDTRERIVMWFEDMCADVLVRRYVAIDFEKLINEKTSLIEEGK